MEISDLIDRKEKLKVRETIHVWKSWQYWENKETKHIILLKNF